MTKTLVTTKKEETKVSKKENQMTTFTESVNKTVLHPVSNEKVKRTANISLPLAADLNEALSIVGNNQETLVKWFNHGRKTQSRTVAANALLGAQDAQTRKLIRQYQETLSMLVDVMEFSKEDAMSSLAKKAVFAPVISYFDGIAKGENNVSFDFSATALKEPRWFGGAEDEADEADEVAA